jgi:hypothetical protein
VINLEERKACPCKRVKCIRYGKCEECRIHHRDKKNPEYCMRKKKEKQK